LLRPRAITVITLALSALAVLAGTASAARADAADAITAGSAASPDDNVGNLAVPLNSTTPVTAATAHVLQGSTDVLDLSLSQTSVSASAPYQSVWTVTSPVTEAQLPLGAYSVTIDATDQGGTSVTSAPAGTWDFLPVAVASISADHTAVDYASRTATVTGTVQAHNPDGSVTPYQGAVTVTNSWNAAPQTVQTDTSGNYSATVLPAYFCPDCQLTVSAAASAGVGTTIRAASSPAVQFTLTYDPVKLTAKLSSAAVNYGSPVSVTGTVTYQPLGQAGYVPAAGAPVKVYKSGNFSSAPDASGVTDMNGNYTIALPKSIGTSWTVDVAGGNGTNVLLDNVEASVTENVLYNTVISGFKVTLNQHWGLSYSGCFGLATAVPTQGVIRPDIIQFQWAPSKTGPWHAMTRTIKIGAGCGNGGALFSGTATAPVNYAYYRTYFPGLPVDAGNLAGWHASASATLLAWKYADRITGLSVSPATVSKNGKITVKGTLQYYFSGWHNYGSQTILIVLQPSGGTAWFWIVKVKTNSKGQFSATFADPVTAHWGAYFDGNSSHLSVQAGNVYVRVR
jgi:hypothetical protein